MTGPVIEFPKKSTCTFDGVDFTVHGDSDLAELALAHVIGSTTEQAYARGSQVEKRRPLMSAWSDFITTEKAQ